MLALSEQQLAEEDDDQLHRGRMVASRQMHTPKVMLKMSKSWFLLVLLFVFGGCRLSGSAEPVPTRAPRILVTNDDGIDSPGLAALVVELAKVGEVVVAAPRQNCSGSSHSVRIRGPLRVVSHKVAGAKEAWAVDGTPADAVRFGILGIGKDSRFDMVVSGINRGANVGLVAHYSGTVGAAMEGVYQGVPGIAVSEASSQRDHGIAARFVARFVKELWSRGSPPGIGYNINVPGGSEAELRGVVVARMGGSFIHVRDYSKTGDETHEARVDVLRDGPRGSDTKAFFAGMITVVPIRLDWTDDRAVDRLREWKLSVR